MRYLVWLLRAMLFLLLLGFAVKNDQSIVLRYFFGYEWDASLVVVLLCFFSAGVLIGVLAMLAAMFRQRRELAALRRELQLKNKLSEMADVRHAPIHPS
jgi:uncharacterized integral membrane protein